MNIFLRELKANFKSLIIWSVIIALFILMGISKFSAYAGNPEMLKILDFFPRRCWRPLACAPPTSPP